jgi:hypothetical protein
MAGEAQAESVAECRQAMPSRPDAVRFSMTSRWAAVHGVSPIV